MHTIAQTVSLKHESGICSGWRCSVCVLCWNSCGASAHAVFFLPVKILVIMRSGKDLFSSGKPFLWIPTEIFPLCLYSCWSMNKTFVMLRRRWHFCPRHYSMFHAPSPFYCEGSTPIVGAQIHDYCVAPVRFAEVSLLAVPTRQACVSFFNSLLSPQFLISSVSYLLWNSWETITLENNSCFGG